MEINFIGFNFFFKKFKVVICLEWGFGIFLIVKIIELYIIYFVSLLDLYDIV